MSAVERAILPSEKQAVEKEREQVSPSTVNARFTAVNRSDSTPTRTTSFRPDHVAPLATLPQHSLPRRTAAPGQSTDPREVPSRLAGDQENERSLPAVRPLLARQTPAQTHPPLFDSDQHDSAGKRKRPLGIVEPLSPKQPRLQLSPPTRLEATRESVDSQRDERNPHHSQHHAALEAHDDNDRRSHVWPGAEQDNYVVEHVSTDVPEQELQDREDESESPLEVDADAGPANQPHQDESPGQKKKQQNRKRNFSQRTKTGCHTCRKRKKKCDEGKPHCKNCIRGNFACQGYGPKSDLEVMAPRPLPLQSKSVPNFERTVHYPTPAETQISNSSSVLSTYLPAYGPGTTYRATTQWVRPPYHNDVNYEPDAAYRSDYSSPSTMYTHGPASHQYNVMPSYGGALEPLKLAGRTGENSQSSFPEGIAPHQSVRLTHVSEKEKMLAGQPYRHYLDEQLIEERKECAIKLERFNNAWRPSADTSEDERSRLFRAIVGSCGHRVIVRPFTCDLGYNIDIGNDVVIEAGCIFLDSCKISIGHGTVIGPGVKFYGRTQPTDPKVRDGSQGMMCGGPIIIEENCFIGGGAAILPNRIIGRGSTVGANTVVSKDVEPESTVCGSPMRVTRVRGVAVTDPHTRRV